jgi:hypothetical protein
VRKITEMGRLTMLCFEVFVNGQKRCTAGVGEFGSLHASIVWYNRIYGEGIFVDEGHNGEFNVSGVEDKDSAPCIGEPVKWLADLVELKPGDELLVRVVESDSADPPIEHGVNIELLRGCLVNQASLLM